MSVLINFLKANLTNSVYKQCFFFFFFFFFFGGGGEGGGGGVQGWSHKNTIKIHFQKILPPNIGTDFSTKNRPEHTSSNQKQCYRFLIFFLNLFAIYKIYVAYFICDILG